MPKEEGDKFVLLRTSSQCLRALLSCKPQQGKKVGGEISGSFFFRTPVRFFRYVEGKKCRTLFSL